MHKVMGSSRVSLDPNSDRYLALIHKGRKKVASTHRRIHASHSRLLFSQEMIRACQAMKRRKTNHPEVQDQFDPTGLNIPLNPDHLLTLEALFYGTG